MKSRTVAIALPLAAGVALVAAVAALADSSQISGAVRNNSCGAVHPVTVSAAARIQASVAASNEGGLVVTQILGEGNQVVSTTGSYDTPGAGTYRVRVCFQDSTSEDQATYSGTVATGPPGQAIGPSSATGVLGATKNLVHFASGWGAIRTQSGLSWFWVRASSDGMVRVHFDNAAMKLHVRATSKMTAVFSTNSVRIAGNGMTLMLVDNGANDRVSFQSRRFKASGTVVRGGLRVD